MIDHLKKKVIQSLFSVHEVILSTFGPAELQSSQVACEARELRIYLLIPRSSDHLLNVDQTHLVVLVSPVWELRGLAHTLPPTETPANLMLAQLPQASWCRLVEVNPTRMTLTANPGAEHIETIDF